MVTSLTFPDIILLSLTLTSSVVALRLLWSLASKKHQRQYGRALTYLFVSGTLLGIVLPWNDIVGLIAAVGASSILLVLAAAYTLLGWNPGGIKALALAWIPRELIRDWFLYLSVGTGVIGVVTTVISLIVSPLFSLSLSSLIPLAFDTVSILSALLEFTVYIPPYHNIFALVYNFIVHSQRVAPSSEEPFLDDLDFKRIAEGTSFTNFEVREALEYLVRRGFASKISPVPVAKIVFKISRYGIRFLKSVWEEVYFSMEREVFQVESRIAYLREKLRYAPAIDRELGKRVDDELRELRKRIGELNEYGLIFGEYGRNELNGKLADLEEIVSKGKNPPEDG